MSSSTSNSSSSVGPTPSTPTTVEDLPSLELGIKYVDSKYDEEKNVWDYEDTTNSDVPAELVQPVGTDTSDENSDWGKFCFIVVRKHSRAQEKHKRTIGFFRRDRKCALLLLTHALETFFPPFDDLTATNWS